MYYSSRKELKSILSTTEAKLVKELIENDANISICKHEFYNISSKYLLVYNSNKNQGKLRIRHYDADWYIEEKIKTNGVVNKNRWKISSKISTQLLSFDLPSDIFEFLSNKKIQISENFILAKRTSNLEVHYDREAWELNYCNESCRITIDSNFSYNDKFISETSYDMIVLEVKSSTEIDFIRFLQNELNILYVPVSKYKIFEKLASYSSDVGKAYGGIEDEFKMYFNYNIDYFTCIMSALNQKFILKKKKNKSITDFYFDTKDKIFKENNVGYRIRSHLASNEKILNLKMPTNKETTMLSRYEYKELLSQNIEKAQIVFFDCKINTIVRERFPNLKFENIQEVFKIQTNREFFEIRENVTTAKLCLGFVCIDHSSVIVSETAYPMLPQLEIELNLEFDKDHNFSELSKEFINNAKEACDELVREGFILSKKCKYDLAWDTIKGVNQNGKN